jgi:hypothetical protein
MSEPRDKGPNAYAAYMVVALVSAAASVVIALVALNKFTQVTDSAMWAMAAMILAPAALGVGVSYFVHRTAVTTADVGRPNRLAPPPL